ncbi:MAG: PEPxxWA-CTERM sorting domain-containing protein [Caulobacterales bacterium]|jgi:hypothetical protein
MGRNWTAALTAAGALAGAGPAAAALVNVTFLGEYAVAETPVGFFPSDQPGLTVQGDREFVNFQAGGVPWTATFAFDTALGQLTTTDFGTGYSSQSFSGPLLSGTFSGFGITRDLSGATSFSITRDPVGLNFAIVGSGYSLHDGWEPFNVTPVTTPSLTTPFFASGEQFFNGAYNDGTYMGGDSFVQRVSLDVAAVPEPATWTLLIVGFGGLGAMLRHRRRYAVA